MTVTLELKPEIEARAVEKAKAHGLPVELYLAFVIEGSLNGGEGNLGATKRSYNSMTPEERARAWEEWAASHDPNTPVILDNSREAIYEDGRR
jgi:hypothetical protein